MSTNFKVAAQHSRCLKASTVEKPMAKHGLYNRTMGLGILVFKNN